MSFETLPLEECAKGYRELRPWLHTYHAFLLRLIIGERTVYGYGRNPGSRAPGRTDRNLVRLYQLLDIPQCVELFRKQEPNLNRKTTLSLLSLIGAKVLYGSDYEPYKGKFPEA
jgi:hypothetical protein